jgi:hypothetical protein
LEVIRQAAGLATVLLNKMQQKEEAMTVPINVRLERPTVSVQNWEQQAQEWIDLNKEVNGNPDFYPLTIKFGYVLGVIHDICECVACLLHEAQFARQTSYIPAYGLFASGIELLGRGVDGEANPGRSTLRAGLRWLAVPRFLQYEQVPENTVLISTSQREYTIDELAHLRNFAAHGLAASAFQAVDYQVISQLRPLLRDGLEHYWAKLLKDDDPCNRLALANVVRLRGWPVLKTWVLLQGNEQISDQSITVLFDRFEQMFNI